MTTYERSYCRWFWQNNKKRLLVYLTVLLTIYVLPIAFTQTDHFQNEMYPMMWAIQLTFVLNLVSAILLPGLLFQPFMKKRSCDLFLPLPIKRNRLFFLQFGFGLCIMVLPDLFFFLSAALESNSWTTIVYDAVALSGCFLLTFCCYAILTFFVVKCNSIVDVVCVSICIPLAAILIVATITDVLNFVILSVVNEGNVYDFFPITEITNFINPFLAGENYLSALFNAYSNIKDPTSSIWQTWFSSSIFTPIMFLYWGIISICFLFGSVTSYKKRLGEDSEQKTTSPFVYPWIIFLITTCLIFQNLHDFGLMWLSLVIFFVLNFIAERKITIHWRMIVSLFIMALLAWGTTSVLVNTKGFDQIYEIVERDRIESVYVSFDMYEPIEFTLNHPRYQKYQGQMSSHISLNDFSKDEALINQIYELHKIGKKEELMWPENGEQTITMYITYMLENGDSNYRQYTFNEQDNIEEAIKFMQMLLDQGLVGEHGFFIPSTSEELERG